MRPALTMIDGYRILVGNGTAGGNPGDVFLKKGSGSFGGSGCG
jgi:hypothetical protein